MAGLGKLWYPPCGTYGGAYPPWNAGGPNPGRGTVHHLLLHHELLLVHLLLVVVRHLALVAEPMLLLLLLLLVVVIFLRATVRPAAVSFALSRVTAAAISITLSAHSSMWTRVHHALVIRHALLRVEATLRGVEASLRDESRGRGEGVVHRHVTSTFALLLLGSLLVTRRHGWRGRLRSRWRFQPRRGTQHGLLRSTGCWFVASHFRRLGRGTIAHRRVFIRPRVHDGGRRGRCRRRALFYGGSIRLVGSRHRVHRVVCV